MGEPTFEMIAELVAVFGWNRLQYLTPSRCTLAQLGFGVTGDMSGQVRLTSLGLEGFQKDLRNITVDVRRLNSGFGCLLLSQRHLGCVLQ